MKGGEETRDERREKSNALFDAIEVNCLENMFQMTGYRHFGKTANSKEAKQIKAKQTKPNQQQINN